MTENEEFIYESIVSQVRMGFLSLDEIKDNIIEEIEDNEFEEEISEKWAIENINKEWSKLITESKQWEKPTDTERLIKAFDDLCKINIIALHNAGYTTDEGEEEIIDVALKLKEKGVKSREYCFYHQQDLERAIDIENPSLYLAFQKINNEDDDVTIEVGKKVSDILRKNGFEVEWNETVNSKILIPNFKWQQIYDENGRDLLDYNEVVKLMTK